MIAKPKGTYDVLPEEVIKWQRLEDLIKKVCKLYNYQEIRTPIFESFEVFHRDQKDSSDMVTKETYDFLDRSDRKLTLRPEGTAGVMRAYIENKLYVDNPVSKLYYVGPMFRYERPQKGRTRQFSQFGVECLGSKSVYADAEVIALGVSILNGLGIKDVKVRINSLGDTESREKYKEVLVDYFSKYTSELCPDCLMRLEKNPLRILDCKVDKDKDFFKASPKIKDYLNPESKARFEELKCALDGLGIKYVVDDNLVRGLDYYSHTVFELEANIEELGNQNVIGAGGRYDSLVKDLGGPDVSGIGMAFGLERLLFTADLIGKKLGIRPVNHVYLIALGDKARAEAFKLMNMLRVGGLSCEMDLTCGSLKSQFKKADNLNSLFTCILGDNELAEFKINIKDNTTDNQETIGLYDVYAYVLNKLNANSKCKSCKENKENESND